MVIFGNLLLSLDILPYDILVFRINRSARRTAWRSVVYKCVCLFFYCLYCMGSAFRRHLGIQLGFFYLLYYVFRVTVFSRLHIRLVNFYEWWCRSKTCGSHKFFQVLADNYFKHFSSVNFGCFFEDFLQSFQTFFGWQNAWSLKKIKGLEMQALPPWFRIVGLLIVTKGKSRRQLEIRGSWIG